MDLVSVVVVNFNGRQRLPACLESLRRQTYPSVEVIVVDNASTDGSIALVHDAFPDVHVVGLRRNVGFATGCNAGIATARGNFIATLNNDARAEPTWIEELVRAAEHRPDVGMVAAKMLFADAPSTINSTGICIDRTAISWDRDGGKQDHEVPSASEVFGPSAGAALYRRQLFDDVGGFDDDFFLYLEDVDLAWRARLAGWRCIFAPGARVLHDHSATANDSSPFKRYHLGRNKVWLVAKNYPMPYLLLYLPVILLFDLAAVALVTLGPESASFPLASRAARVVGRIVGTLTLGRALAKRGSVQRRRRVPRWRVLAEMAGISGPRVLFRRHAHLFERAKHRIANLTTA